MIKSKGMELMELINQLGQIETIDTEITFAIFRSSTQKRMEEKVNELINKIKEQMITYGIENKEYEEQNEKIITKYKEVLKKMYTEYENSIISIQLEMQEAESNQKVAIAGFKKIADVKKENITMLQNNPAALQKYIEKENACIKKFNDYNTILDECLIETEMCRKEFLKELDKINIITQEMQLVKKSSKFQEIIQKIKNVFNGKRYYEAFLNNIEQNILNLESINEPKIKEVSNQNVKFIATIIVMRKKINNSFKLAVS